MGDYFIQDLIISLEDSFEASNACTPLIFILSPGDDPADNLKKFSIER